VQKQQLWSVLFAAVILAEVILVLVAPLVGWGLPKDISNYGHEVDNLFHLILAITGIVFLLTEGLLIYYMYRYGSQPGRRGLYVHGNHKLEFAWTLVPAIILLFITFAQVGAWGRIKYVSRMPEPDHVIEVSARQFEWRVRYPHTKPSAPEAWARKTNADIDDVHRVNEVHVWKGANVKVYLQTRDVIHSFFLPNLRVKQDALPGKTIPVWFHATEANTKRDGDTWVSGYRYDEASREWKKDPEYLWELACAELCGWGHYKMQGLLYVHESKADYEAWLQQAAKDERYPKP